jgi:release factor glutamine methyltransferase
MPAAEPDAETRAAPDAALVARLRAAGCVFAEEEAALLESAVAAVPPAEAAVELERLVVRRVAGDPIEQLLGWAEFGGIRILLEPGVFVPRRRTELLAETAAALSRQIAASGRVPVVLDLCCGAGAIGAVIADAAGPVDLVAADLDPAAVLAARRNLEPRGGRVFEGDLFEAVPADLHGRFDVVAVNAPYVPTEAIAMMPPEARDHEARIALDGGGDGLDVHRRVAASAALWLSPGGSLIIETSRRQAATTQALVEAGGLSGRIEHDDDRGGTIVIGRNAGSPAPRRPSSA